MAEEGDTEEEDAAMNKVVNLEGPEEVAGEAIMSLSRIEE